MCLNSPLRHVWIAAVPVPLLLIVSGLLGHTRSSAIATLAAPVQEVPMSEPEVVAMEVQALQVSMQEQSDRLDVMEKVLTERLKSASTARWNRVPSSR